MKRIIFIVVFAYSNLLFAQENLEDTLVYFNEITYHSEFEKTAFHNYFIEEKNNFAELFFSKEKNYTYEDYEYRMDKFNEYIHNDLAESVSGKNNKKKIKYVYNKIHDKYLVKYDIKSFFPDIFKQGYYNCVTGSILYGLAFNGLNIPFNIKVSPVHAYIVAFPEEESILVETTNPTKGYYIFNTSFKDNYVKHLKESKQISVEEYTSNTADQLFDMYYFKEKTISLKEMVGIQYYNDAIGKLQNQNFEDAFYELEKAYLFYPSKDIAYLLFFTAALVIDKHDFSDLKHVDFIYKIARFTNFGITREQIVGEFTNITLNQLDYKGNYEIYDSIYHRLYNNLDDQETKNEIAFIYNYEKARLFLRNNRIEDAQPFIEAAYLLRPEHLDLQTMMTQCAINKLVNRNITVQLVDEFVDYVEKFPKLKEYDFYKDMLCDAYIKLAIDFYNMGELQNATKYHELFNKICTNRNNYSLYDANVPNLYSAAAVYYFRKGYNSKSKQMILKGLELVPDSYELKQRLRAFN